MQQADI